MPEESTTACRTATGSIEENNTHGRKERGREVVGENGHGWSTQLVLTHLCLLSHLL